MKTPQAYLTQQVLVNSVINFIIAYFIAKFSLATLSIIPMQAPSHDPMAPNMAGDLLVGSFIAAVIITLVLSKITHWELTSKKIDNSQMLLNNWFKLLPNSTFKRAILLGLFAALIIAMPVVITLNLLGVQQANTDNYIIVHAVYAAIMGGIITYIACKRALVDF